MELPRFPILVSALAQGLRGRWTGPDLLLQGVGSLGHAEPDQLTFVRDARWRPRVTASRAGAFLAPWPLEEAGGKPVIVLPDPSLAFSRLLESVAEERCWTFQGVSPLAAISPGAQVGENTAVGAYCVISTGAKIGPGSMLYPHVTIGPGVAIGAGARLYPNVVVREGTRIGERVTIHPGTVIGGDGFGFVREQGDRGHPCKIPQVGGVRIGDDVEIGSLVTVDRATLDHTVIGNRVKIDSHVHLGHNAVVEDDCLLVAYARLAGHAVIKKGATLAADVGVSGGITVGEGASVGAASSVFENVPAGEKWWGRPARPLAREKKIQAILGRLPSLRDQLRKLTGKLPLLAALALLGTRPARADVIRLRAGGAINQVTVTGENFREIRYQFKNLVQAVPFSSVQNITYENLPPAFSRFTELLKDRRWNEVEQEIPWLRNSGLAPQLLQYARRLHLEALRRTWRLSGLLKLSAGFVRDFPDSRHLPEVHTWRLEALLATRAWPAAQEELDRLRPVLDKNPATAFLAPAWELWLERVNLQGKRPDPEVASRLSSLELKIRGFDPGLADSIKIDLLVSRLEAGTLAPEELAPLLDPSQRPELRARAYNLLGDVLRARGLWEEARRNYLRTLVLFGEETGEAVPRALWGAAACFRQLAREEEPAAGRAVSLRTRLAEEYPEFIPPPAD